MNLPSLIGALALVACVNTQALETQRVPQATLLSLAATLASEASSTQWQQLWQRTRDAGHFTVHPDIAHFSVAQHEIPALVAATLAHADSVTPTQSTQALYRRDFSPRVLGVAGASRYSALCLWVDWRTLPQAIPDTPAYVMKQVSLLLAQPCA